MIGVQRNFQSGRADEGRDGRNENGSGKAAIIDSAREYLHHSTSMSDPNVDVCSVCDIDASYPLFTRPVTVPVLQNARLARDESSVGWTGALLQCDWLYATQDNEL